MLSLIKLSDLVIDRGDFITSDKIFYYIQSLNRNDVKYFKTDFMLRRDIKNGNMSIYGWRNLNESVKISDLSFLISGHADYEINAAFLDILNSPKLKFWLCENKNIQHSKLFSVPIGITNSGEPNSYIHQVIGNTDRIYEISKLPKTIKNLVYLNIAADTYPPERSVVIQLYKDRSWVTYDNPVKTEGGHQHFLQQIYSHKFVFAPRGNGIDTHRMWEALYLRSIPIVKKCIGMEDFYDLPILFVDSWDNITEEFLNEKYEEIMSKTYNMEKVKIGYWYKFIDDCVSKL
jgi:hypothetical protein